jgi:D-alanyl-D-alanine carboxypeptidase
MTINFPIRKVLLGFAIGSTLMVSGCSDTDVATPAITESVTAPVADGLPSTLTESLQATMEATRQELGFPGAIAGVWTPAGAWIGTTGTNGPDSSEPPTVADHTRIGSLTKTFTVMALLQLVDQGLVSLDDVIGTYVPNVPNANTATLRDLASMTSGIPSYSDEEFVAVWGADPNMVFTPEQLVDFVADAPASFPAGTQMEYSNTNTVLLGMVIEQVTDIPVAEVFEQNLLTPLNMTQTSFPDSSPDLPEPRLAGISEQTEPWGEVKNATFWNPSWTFTAGGMVSTLEDVRTWTVALGTGGGLISEELQQQRMDSVSSTVSPNTPELGYAMGFFNASGWWGHNGSIPGFTTYAVYNAESETSVVVFVNSDIYGDGDPPIPPADLIAERLITALG